MFSCDLAQALAEPVVAKDGFAIEIKGPATDVPALKFGPAHASFHRI